MGKKQGQAAMEFLMTYGWAILVVLIAIMALSYFGVLSPGKFLPTSCIFEAGISCDDFYINTSHFKLAVRNGMGMDIILHQFRLKSEDRDFYSDPIIPPLNLSNGQGAIYTLNITNQFSHLRVGSRAHFDVKINYTKKDTPSIMHILEGKIIGLVHER